MSKEKSSSDIPRRKFLEFAGRALCTGVIGGTAYRLLAGANDKNDCPQNRYAWQINPDLCTGCGLCETKCVQSRSAVKAVNDQKKCSFCVVCYGHIKDKTIDSDKVMSHGIKICPYDAVERESYSGTLNGTFVYTIDEETCTGCGKCVKDCTKYGTKSMFLLIRPDICLGCNSCQIAAACPENAIERLHIGTEDNYKGEYGMDDEYYLYDDMADEQ